MSKIKTYKMNFDKMNKQEILSWFEGLIARDDDFVVDYVMSNDELYNESKEDVFNSLKQKPKYQLIEEIIRIDELSKFPYSILQNL